LKTASVVSGVLASAGVFPKRVSTAATDVIGPDYPIHPRAFFEVTLTDAFWKPKVATNATVTIPFEVQKLQGSQRGLTGNGLEAAMMSLRTHPNPELQAQVDAAVRSIASKPGEGNG